MLIEKAVCMHEEDAGLLWKHVEYRTNHSEVRRSRRLVLSFIATVSASQPGRCISVHALMHFQVVQERACLALLTCPMCD